MASGMIFPLFPQPERLQHQGVRQGLNRFRRPLPNLFYGISRFPQPERLAHHKVRQRLTTSPAHALASQPEGLKLITKKINPPIDKVIWNKDRGGFAI